MDLPGISVVVRNNDLEGALTVFRKKSGVERLVVDSRRHEFHLSRTERRRIKDRQSLKRILKKTRMYS